MRRILLLSLILLAPATAAAQRTLSISGEQRVALVIGNAAYKEARLINPVNDARAMADALERLGFVVIKRENVKSREIGSALREFRSRLTPGAVALFFYAGHGLQVRGVNYLPAVDAEIEAEEDVANQSLDMTKVLELLDEAKTRISLVFLDACRNNPFSRRFRSASRGLAKVDAASGTLISFATRPGSVAADGEGKNGLYTEHLLNHMATAGLPIEQMLKRVGADVKLASKGRQEPWSEGLLEGDFYFRPAAPAAVAAPSAMDPAVLELALWDSVKNSRNAEELAAYLEQYPKGQFAGVARARLKGLGVTAPVAAPAAPAPRPAAAPAQQLALAAPAAAVSLNPDPGDGPQPGDSWTYRLTQRDRKDEQREQRYSVNVTSVSGGVIVERYALESGKTGLARHERGGYLTPLGPALFSPYLPVFQELAAGGNLGSIVVREGTCTSDYTCDAVARVVGRETVTVPAGRFDAIKVTVSHSWRAASAGSGHQAYIAQMNGGRVLTVWYAPKARRAVKFSSRLQTGDYPAVESNFDLELISYELRAPSTTAATPVPLAAPSVEIARLVADLPKTGDNWTYRLTQLDRKDEFRQQRYTVDIATVSETGISERFSLESGETGLARHGSGSYLAAVGPALFSPYLPLFRDLKPGENLGQVVVRGGACSNDYACDAQARVVGLETITVPAGKFDTVKVTVSNTWRSAGSGHQQFIAQMNGGRTMTVWYAPKVKRVVKVSSRLAAGDYPAVDSNFDLELTSYQVK